MEGYKDSVISKSSEMTSPMNRMTVFEMGSGKRSKKEVGDTEYLQKERNRRSKEAKNFSLLQSMVPRLFSTSKASRETVVIDAINYIKNLEEEKQRLENLKQSLAQNQTESSAGKPFLCQCIKVKPSVTSSFCDGYAFLVVKSVMKHGLLGKIVGVFDEYLGDEVLFVTNCVDDHGMLTLMAKFNLGSDGNIIIEKIKQEIQSLE